jgi:hypothetical protein
MPESGEFLLADICVEIPPTNPLDGAELVKSIETLGGRI